MKLRHPSKNNRNIWNELDNKSDELEYILLLNNMFEKFEIKIEKIKDKVIYEILEINQNPKEYRRSLKRSKQW
jgi:hypothetical protein